MYQRRTSTEQFSPHLSPLRGQSPASLDRRKLSFSPIPEWTPPTAKEIPIGAHEVPQNRRILQIFIAVVYCLLAAGVVFGFAALKPVLISQGVYAERCTEQEVEEGVYVCYKQELGLNVMFTVAAVSTNVAALPIGTILDHYGPRVASLIGVGFLALGAVTMAFAGDMPFDAYIPGYFFLALGGPFIFISSFQLSNAFPRRSGLILALLTCAFDTSSAIFLLYRLVYQSSEDTTGDSSFTLRKFFLLYLVVPAFILAAQLLIMPANSYKTVGELLQEEPETPTPRSDPQNPDPNTINSSEITALLGPNDSKPGSTHAATETLIASNSGVFGALHGFTARQQIATPWFLLITAFTILQMLRINYFLATIRSQYTYLLSSLALSTQINRTFDILLPLGGILAIPFVGHVLDNTSTAFVLFCLVSIATLIGILGCIPSLPAAYANIITFVLYRPFYYTAVSDYSAKVFGFATFGKVYGLIICLAGVGNFAQAGLDALTLGKFEGDPIPVNVGLLIAGAGVGAGLVGFVWWKARVMRREGGVVDGLVQDGEGIMGYGTNS